MKCSVCGKEFGNNENCQYCGVDKVRGLANYNGYCENGNQGANNPQNGVQYNPSMIACYSCGEIIPANSKFCPYCSKQLYVTCPKCGNTYSSQFPACNKCGINRDSYYKQQEAERQRKLREEKEREREQREQREREEKQRQREQQEDEELAGCWGFFFLLVGTLMLVVAILYPDKLHPGKDLSFIIMAIVIIVPGIILLINRKQNI